MAAGFLGPLFVVGMPRSGTKLMRALLNQHSQVNLTLAESHFIPYFVRKFGNPPPFRVRSDVNRFVHELQQTAFISTMRKAGYTINESTFLQNVDYTKWGAIFEHVFRHFGPKRETIGTIWGDKTPGYINHMPLLKELFPETKILHVLRDPRDYCLSVRKSFKKSIYRAALRWRNGVGTAHNYGRRLGQDYLEIHYERLLEEPVPTMTQVSSFLGVSYEPTLVNLASAPEDLGDARGHSRILRRNKNKYRAELRPREIRRIEEVVCEVAKSVGYDSDNNVIYKALNPLALRILKIHDGIASLNHHIVAEGNLRRGTERFFYHYMRSSWRNIKN